MGEDVSFFFSLAGNFRVPGACGEPECLLVRSRAPRGTCVLPHRTLLPLGRTVLALPGAGEDPVEQEEVSGGSGSDGAALQPFWAAQGSSFLSMESQGMIPTRLHPWKFCPLKSCALTHDPVYSGLLRGAFSERKDFFSGPEWHLSRLLEVFTP